MNRFSLNLWLKVRICRLSIHAFGKTDALNNAMSECAELIQAIEKIRRAYKKKSDIAEEKDHLIEECADVFIAIVNLMEIYNFSIYDVNRWIAKKQARQEHRVREVFNED